MTVSDNHDKDRILQTVASSVLLFFKKYPDARITFNGSTEARTRMYMMEISKRLSELDEAFEIQGLKEEDGWESFRKNGRYKAILVTPRNDVNYWTIMSAPVKRARRKTTAKKAVVVSKKVKDFSKAPFFAKKAKEMETLLKEHGLPKKMVHA